MQPIAKHAFVQMDNPMQREYTCASGIKIHLPDHVLNAEEWCTCVCSFYSGDFVDVEGTPLIKGDTVAVDYQLLSDYDIDKDNNRTYNRVMAYGDEVVWYADEYMIFGVLRDGEWVAVGDWVIMEEIPIQIPESEFIIIPDSVKSQKRAGEGLIVSGSEFIRNDIVYFDGSFAMKYDLMGVKYIILEKDKILALKPMEYATN